MLKVTNLKTKVEEKEILKGITLEVSAGEVVAVMGPNGAGKSTLANALMGAPHLESSGDIELDGVLLNNLETNERAEKGLFLSFQHPSEIPGVTIKSLLMAICRKKKNFDISTFNKELQDNASKLYIKSEFLDRGLNEGFSGGEKKKAEILQLAMLKPKFAILDETDSGLDVDALKIVAEGINAVKNSETGMLVITHYPRLLELLKPDRVLVLQDGLIVREGGPGLAYELEKEGYNH